MQVPQPFLKGGRFPPHGIQVLGNTFHGIHIKYAEYERLDQAGFLVPGKSPQAQKQNLLWWSSI